MLVLSTDSTIHKRTFFTYKSLRDTSFGEVFAQFIASLQQQKVGTKLFSRSLGRNTKIPQSDLWTHVIEHEQLQIMSQSDIRVLALKIKA